MKRLLSTAAPVLAVAAALPGGKTDRPAERRHCGRLFTVKMGERAARAIYRDGHRVTLANLRLLGYIERCQRNPRAQWFVRWFDRRQGALQAARAYAASRPFATAFVSWYTDAGATASGFHSFYGVADCGSGGGPCFAFGTRIEFCDRGCVTATVDDHGPYVSGRAFDLNQHTAAAIGFDGVGDVTWRLA